MVSLNRLAAYSLAALYLTACGAEKGPGSTGGAEHAQGGLKASAETGGAHAADGGASLGGSGGSVATGGKRSDGGAPASLAGSTASGGAHGGSTSGASGAPGGADGHGGASGNANGGASGALAGSAGTTGGGSAGATGHAGASQAGAAGSGSQSTTCSGSKLTKGDSKLTLDVGGTTRSYILHVPAKYTGTTRVPLVLDFHGLGGSGSQEQGLSGYQALADSEGFLIAFPDGIDNAWNIGPCCTNSRDVDDLGFAKAMVTSISADGCVDAQRVYATGFSMGGGMSQYLACNAADVFAAVTPASFDLLVPDEEPCAPSRPIAVLAFRGTADTVVPFAGGKGSSGRVTFLGAQGSFERWAGIDDCMEPTTSDGDCTYYEQCAAGVKLGLCVKQGGTHAPGDANAGWAFLKQFTLP